MPQPWFSKGVPRGVIAGYRSGLEKKVAAQLQAAGVPATYEDKASKVRYVKPASEHTYLPDFVLPNGIIIETKGRFMPEHRKKHLLNKEQHPGLDIRFVFSNPHAPIYKGSKTSYADWCRTYGFKFAAKLIPPGWLTGGSYADG